MAAWLDRIVDEERALHPGHAACPGCGPAINVRHVLGALSEASPGTPIVLVVPASCLTIVAGAFPVNAFGVPVHLTPFASAAAEASGIKAALRLSGRGATTVVVWAGDGSTSDIGLSGVSAAADRGEDLVYVLNDNEAYMNTGVQRSGATPEGAWTTTTPAGALRAGQKKDVAAMIAAQGVPYVATLAAGTVPMLRDFRAKVAKAATIEGFRFLHVLGACPPGWRFPTSRTTEVTRLAVESGVFPLWECEHGTWRITYQPKRPVPIAAYLAAQGRFAGLTPEQMEMIGRHVSAHHDRLACRCAQGASERKEERWPQSPARHI